MEPLAMFINLSKTQRWLPRKGLLLCKTGTRIRDKVFLGILACFFVAVVDAMIKGNVRRKGLLRYSTVQSESMVVGWHGRAWKQELKRGRKAGC